MPRYSRLAVLLLACMVGSLFRPLDEGARRQTRASLDAPAVLALPVATPKVRAKPQADGNGTLGLAVAIRAAIEPIRVVGRVESHFRHRLPRGTAHVRVPARAPPLS